ncbi:MAG: hypothetical protein ACOZBW_14510 [Thermodesulfobacteriota bacterium]
MRVNRRTGNFLILALLLAVAGAGCGRKAMPVAPGVAVPARVADLAAEPAEDGIRLVWSLPADNAGGPVDGFRVFRARRPLTGDPCPACPPDFQPAGRVAADPPPEGLFFRYSETAEKGYRYTYYVTGYADGVAGPPSNRVEIVHE